MLLIVPSEEWHNARSCTIYRTCYSAGRIPACPSIPPIFTDLPPSWPRRKPLNRSLFSSPGHGGVLWFAQAAGRPYHAPDWSHSHSRELAVEQQELVHWLEHKIADPATVAEAQRHTRIIDRIVELKAETAADRENRPARRSFFDRTSSRGVVSAWRSDRRLSNSGGTARTLVSPGSCLCDATGVIVPSASRSLVVVVARNPAARQEGTRCFGVPLLSWHATAARHRCGANIFSSPR